MSEAPESAGANLPPRDSPDAEARQKDERQSGLRSSLDERPEPGSWLPPVRLHRVGEDPDYRFTLANERTFLAWIRTSLALLAGGIAVIKLVPSFSVAWGRHLLGIPLVLISIGVSFWAYGHWFAAERAMRLRQTLPASWLPVMLGGAVGAIGVIALIVSSLGNQ